MMKLLAVVTVLLAAAIVVLKRVNDADLREMEVERNATWLAVNKARLRRDTRTD
jgi:hypothetical protein